MNQSVEQIVPLSVLVAVCVLCSLPNAGGQGTAADDAQITTHLKALGDDVDAIKAVRAAFAAKLPKPGAEPALFTFTFSLPRLFSWHDRLGNRNWGDLPVTLYHSNGKTIALPAPHPGNGDMPCYIDASLLQVSATGLNGAIKVRVGDMWSANPTVGIKASVSGSNISGTYSVDAASGLDGPREEAFTGKAIVPVPRVIPPPAKADADGTGGLSDEQYGKAKSMEGVSIGMYDDVRAIVLSLGGRVSYAHATTITASERYGYPPLPKLSSSGKVEKKVTATATPSLDDVMAESTDELGTATKKVAAPAGISPVVRAALAKELARIRERVAYRRRILESVQANGAPDPVPVVGMPDTGDPAFGPWYGDLALPADKSRVNIIPADAGAAGAQSWLLVAGWIAFGPFSTPPRGFETPTIPDFIPGKGLYVAKDLPLRAARRKGGSSDKVEITPEPADVEPGSGFNRVIFSETFEDHGPQRVTFPFTSTYAWTEVNCDADKDLWVGVTVNDHGQLWINDALAWTSTPDRPVRHMEETGMFRAKFRKGVNRLYLRCDNLKDDSYFVVRVCVRGGARTPAEVAAGKAGQEKAGSPADGVWGWRHDFAGHHGDKVTAPIAWDPHEMRNVKWINPMGFCYSSPLVVGDRLVTFEEPHTAVCVDKMTGAEIWRRDCDIVETKDAKTQEEARPVKEKADAARQELVKLGVDRKSRVDTLVKGGSDAAAATTKVQEMEKAAGAYATYLEQKNLIPHMGWYNDVGHTFPTPVTDGKFIYVKVNTGALACLDLNGKLKWIVNHGVATADCGAACPSPLLVSGRLIVFGPEDEAAAKKGKVKLQAKAEVTKVDDDAPPPVQEILVTGGFVLKAFDPSSGNLVWRVETQVGGQICGTPTALRLSNGKDTMDVIVTANGTLVRADDGKVLRSFVGVREFYGSPAAEGNLFTISENKAKSLFELTMIDRDTVGVRRRWYVDHVGHFQDGNFGTFQNGKLYFSRPLLDVTDVASGNLAWCSDNIFFCRPGRGYAPIASAGGRLYCADNATWFQPTYRPYLMPYPGGMPVLEIGDPPMLLTCNLIDRISGGFSFDDERLYIRGARALMCIGYTGDSGRAWEAETVAEELFTQFMRDKPQKGDVVRTAKAIKSPNDTRWAAFMENPAGRNIDWIVVGPFPAAGTSDAIVQLSGDWAGYRNGGSTELRVGNQTVPVQVLGGGNYNAWAEDVPFRLLSRDRFTRGPHIGWNEMMGRRVNVSKVLPPGQGAVGLMACILRGRAPRTYRFDAVDQRIRCFVGGAEVKHNQCVEIPAGAVPLVLVVELDPAQGAKDFFVRPQFFWPSSGYDADMAAWTKAVTRRQPYLEKAATLAPSSESGKRAKAVLAAAK